MSTYDNSLDFFSLQCSNFLIIESRATSSLSFQILHLAQWKQTFYPPPTRSAMKWRLYLRRIETNQGSLCSFRYLSYWRVRHLFTAQYLRLLISLSYQHSQLRLALIQQYVLRNIPNFRILICQIESRANQVALMMVSRFYSLELVLDSRSQTFTTVLFQYSSKAEQSWRMEAFLEPLKRERYQGVATLMICELYPTSLTPSISWPMIVCQFLRIFMPRLFNRITHSLLLRKAVSPIQAQQYPLLFDIPQLCLLLAGGCSSTVLSDGGSKKVELPLAKNPIFNGL